MTDTSSPHDRGEPDRGTGWNCVTAPPVTTLLLRHGDTPLSPQKRFSGVSEVGLSADGVAQAQAAARRLAERGGISAVLSSPLRRARQTAEIVADGLGGCPVLVDDDLRETDFGEWEGLTFEEVRAAWPDEAAAWSSDPAVAPPGGESFADTLTRLQRVRARVVERLPAGTVLLVSHVGAIKTLVVMALRAPLASMHRMFLDSACLSEIDWFRDGTAVVRVFNDTAHLRDAGCDCASRGGESGNAQR
ncbi:hypothetical protein Acsp04_41560 [Actinomadura sp. NBRC 104425]|uniref:histidine phosphatase family protein n=1 Tax=Actinomadura sp. NBRC 104425 TaxID=3032204 RepID=UPI0024A359D5|nr:histidine phosphatase family protein [Actinomadura sp. NBRC 104425]GLZ13921.1 hypothetical protein Acsp04_41560 [Actinomadura sp. NBRC 104425]